MSNGVADKNGMPSPPSTPAPKKGGRFAQIKPFLAPLLITCILLGGDLTYSILPSYKFTGLAILSSILLEIVLRRVATGQWPRWLHLASCYITGISVGILVQAYTAWPFILGSMLSISSKYALRIKGRHLFNPSNLGVSILLFFGVAAPLSQQWGNEMWPLLVVMGFGSIILFTLGRLHITLTYAVAYTVLAVIRSYLTDDKFVVEMALLTAPAYQLFMFFMITDPATTTHTRGRRCAVAVLVAVVESIFRLCREIHAPYYALFVVAPATNLLEIWWESRRAAQRAAPSVMPLTLPVGGTTAQPQGVQAS